jgi:phasin family protein
MASLTTRANDAPDVTKIWSVFRLPGVDVDSIVASQRKNFEALMQANQLAVEAARAMLRRQIETASQSMDDLSTIVRDMVQPNGSSEDRIAKQAQRSKQVVEKGLANARELVELVAKANTDAINVIGKRVTESLDELREYARTRTTAE